MHLTQATTRMERAPLRAKIAAVLACAAPFAANAVPVLPQGAGYGMETPAGRGGVVHRVTNLNASGPGSLAACAKATGPRVCVFEVSGVIRLTDDINIVSPNLTIAGQTAPSPGIMIRGAGLNIGASDVLLQHLRIRPGDAADGPDSGNRDALKISAAAPFKNVVVDHCSLSWAMDETVSLWSNWDNVTISNSIISEGLYWQPEEGHSSGYGMLIGPRDARVTIIGNLFAHNRDRNPLTRAKQFVFVNNVVYNNLTTALQLQSENGLVTNNTILGNVFLRGPDTGTKYTSVIVRTDAELGLPTASKVYVADNAAAEVAAGNDWSIVSAYSGSVASSLKTALPPTWPAGLTRLPTSENVVLEQALKYAGARPADRDSVDTRVVKSVRDRSGRIITCVSPDGTARCSKNAGGWPTLAQNRRTLTLPENHNEMTPRGYTRLELWLHAMAAQVEGRPTDPPRAPVLASDR